MLLQVVTFLRSIHKLEDFSLSFCGSFFSPLNIEVEIKLGYYMGTIQDNQNFQIWATKSTLRHLMPGLKVS